MSQLDYLKKYQEEQESKNKQSENGKEEFEKKKAEREKQMVSFTLPDKGSVTALVRFIAPADGLPMFYEYARHNIVIGEKSHFYFCPRVDGQPCPICSKENGNAPLITKYWDNDKPFYYKAKLKTTYTWLCYVKSVGTSFDGKIEAKKKAEITQANDSLSGTVRYLTVSKELNEIIIKTAVGNPSMKIQPITIESYDKGCDFMVTAKTEEIVNSENKKVAVTKMTISKESVGALSDEDVKKIEASPRVAPKTFMEESKKEISYDEMKSQVLSLYETYKNAKDNISTPQGVNTGSTLDNY